MSGKTDKAHKALKEFQRKKYNKACFVCAKTGIMANVDMKTKTFVCTQCGGLLRELSHPIKGVSMTRFGQEEVDALLAGGNRRAAKTWLAGLPETFKRPDADNGKAVKAFMVRLYSGSEWHASKHPKAAKKKSSKKKKAAAAAADAAAAPGQGIGRSESAIDLDAELEKGPAKAAKPVEAPVVDLLAGLEDLDFQPVAPPQPASRGADPFGGGGGADEDSDGNPFGSSDEEDSDSDEDDDEDDAPPPVQDDNGFGSFGFDDEPAPQQPSHQQQGSMHDFFAEAPAPAPVQPVLQQQQQPPPQQAAFPADRGAALRGLVDYIGKLRSSFNMSPAEVRAEVQRALDQTVGPAPVQQPPAPAASPFGVDPSPPPPAASPFGGPPPPQQHQHHQHHQHGAPSGGGGYPPQQHGGFPPQQHGGYPPQQHQQHGGGYPPQQHGGGYPPQQQGYPPQQQQQQQQFGGPPGGPPGGPYGGPPPAEPAFVPESRQPPPKVEDPGADDMFSFANPLG